MKMLWAEAHKNVALISSVSNGSVLETTWQNITTVNGKNPLYCLTKIPLSYAAQRSEAYGNEKISASRLLEQIYFKLRTTVCMVPCFCWQNGGRTWVFWETSAWEALWTSGVGHGPQAPSTGAEDGQLTAALGEFEVTSPCWHQEKVQPG